MKDPWPCQAMVVTAGPLQLMHRLLPAKAGVQTVFMRDSGRLTFAMQKLLLTPALQDGS